MFEYFYNEVFRKTIIGFGTLFNQIRVETKDDSGNTKSSIKVPLAYAPKQKFLARLEQQPDLNKSVQLTLPRMSFEFVGLSYDASRKPTATQTFLTKSPSGGTGIQKQFLPVPYNMEFELSIYTKHNDDMLQIVEQILPYFQPAYTITIELLEPVAEKRDIPVRLDNIDMEDNYEGDFSERRALIYTLRFTVKTHLFGPVGKSAEKDIIKRVSVGYVADGSTRDVTYSVTPVAAKNYTGPSVTTSAQDIQIADTTIEVVDASSIPENSYISLNSETLYVKSKSGNTLVVDRGSYETTIAKHVLGTEIFTIDSDDNALIEFGDNFGFDGTF